MHYPRRAEHRRASKKRFLVTYMSEQDISVDRRKFLKTAALAGVAAPFLSTPLEAAVSHPGKSVMGLRAPPIEKVRIGVVGLGMRGSDAVGRLLAVGGLEINALCDIRPEKVASAQETLAAKGCPPAKEFGAGLEDWKRMCESEDLDLVYNCTPWNLHTPISVFAMKAGKHAVTEVPAATSLEECWDLVHTAEKTRKHCMMLENCCYGETEMFALNLCRLGMLGELLHGEAAYLHDLRALKFDEKNGYQGMWRLHYSRKYNGNLYPTHGLGPVCQYLGINRGDRFDYLTSASTIQRGLTLYAEKKFGPASPYATDTYRLGDMNTTLIRTVKGRTIMVQHNTTSPRPYSRLNHIQGTKGCFADYPPRLALDDGKSETWMEGEKLREYLDEYRHPLWEKLGESARKAGGHGGMDFVMDWRLINCLRAGEPLDQSVYDAAAWSSVFPLSCQSVAHRSDSVGVPDFTRGVWEETPPLPIIS